MSHLAKRVLAALIAFFLLSGIIPTQSAAQPLAKGKSKFLGSSMSDVRSDFASRWNQVTPENAGKWGSVEGSQGSFNWTPLDGVYNFAVTNQFTYKHHNLVWGQQQPSWITSLDSAGQRAAVGHWINEVAQRYGSSSYVDVVNEPFHAVPSYAPALGGSGATGWDWVVTAFQMARTSFFRGVKLLLNEYNILQDNTATTNYIRLIDTLLVRKLIDGVGIQGHYFEFRSPAGAVPAYAYPVATLKANLDRITATGLPVYISEFDIDEAADSTQLQNYQVYFPLFWEDPGVRGITLWGYGQGVTWKPNAYLIRTNGSERPALTWLRRYVAIPYLPVPQSPVGATGTARNPLLVWHPSASAISYRVQVAATGGFTTLLVDSTLADTTVRLDPLAIGTRYYWHVSAANDSGASSYSATATFVTGDQIASSGVTPGSPVEWGLSQNYPNPFNPETVINYRIGSAGVVDVKVYDVLGREIATLVHGMRSPGSYSVTFDGARLPSGVYLYRLQSKGGEIVRKMNLVK